MCVCVCVCVCVREWVSECVCVDFCRSIGVQTVQIEDEAWNEIIAVRLLHWNEMKWREVKWIKEASCYLVPWDWHWHSQGLHRRKLRHSLKKPRPLPPHYIQTCPTACSCSGRDLMFCRSIRWTPLQPGRGKKPWRTKRLDVTFIAELHY